MISHNQNQLLIVYDIILETKTINKSNIFVSIFKKNTNVLETTKGTSIYKKRNYSEALTFQFENNLIPKWRTILNISTYYRSNEAQNCESQ